MGVGVHESTSAMTGWNGSNEMEFESSHIEDESIIDDQCLRGLDRIRV
jgi:hypothetical protein